MSNDVNSEPKRELLRHAVATLAYRGGKSIRGAPKEFAVFQDEEGTRSPGKILAHMGDLMDWALSMADGRREWRDSPPLEWEKEVERFFAALKRFDDFLASEQTLRASPEKLLQGPIADALSHTGQIAMLRRMAGLPIKSENYYVAEIAAGRVGPEQAPPKREF